MEEKKTKNWRKLSLYFVCVRWRQRKKVAQGEIMENKGKKYSFKAFMIVIKGFFFAIFGSV